MFAAASIEPLAKTGTGDISFTARRPLRSTGEPCLLLAGAGVHRQHVGAVFDRPLVAHLQHRPDFCREYPRRIFTAIGTVTASLHRLDDAT